jgi:ABC-type nitrate/sulfonate/bicarbonate transport system permease component
VRADVRSIDDRAIDGATATSVGATRGPSARGAWLQSVALRRTISIASPLILIGWWEIAARMGWIDTRFFPAPSTILVALYAMLQPTRQYPQSELWLHLSASLTRIAVGYVVGTLPGIILGLAMGLSPLVRAAIQPLVDATFPIPKIAILPLFIMLFGIGEISKYAIIAVAVVYLVLINTQAGVRAIDSIYLDVGKNFGASRWMMFWDIALPGALPMIVAGMRLSLGIALLIIVTAESLAAKSGIGYLIWTSWQVFQVEKMYVGLLVSAILGVVTVLLLNWLERWLIPWKRPA